jgi:hypothetical protein
LNPTNPISPMNPANMAAINDSDGPGGHIDDTALFVTVGIVFALFLIVGFAATSSRKK